MKNSPDIKITLCIVLGLPEIKKHNQALHEDSGNDNAYLDASVFKKKNIDNDSRAESTC
jgi:hypothetical protein